MDLSLWHAGFFSCGAQAPERGGSLVALRRLFSSGGLRVPERASSVVAARVLQSAWP